MLTIEVLREYGANIEDGLTRCMNNEAFYIRLVNMSLSDDKVDQLDKAIQENDLDKAFQIAHSLKGIFTNLALTPISDPVTKITDLLRNKQEMD